MPPKKTSSPKSNAATKTPRKSPAAKSKTARAKPAASKSKTPQKKVAPSKSKTSRAKPAAPKSKTPQKKVAPAKATRTPKQPRTKAVSPSVAKELEITAGKVKMALAALEKKSTQHDRDNLARFGITAHRPIGVSMANMRVLAKQLGRDHALAMALWDTEIYEARMLATLVDEPGSVSAAQMDTWCDDFDNWAICDTACFCLFDRTPHAFAKVRAWCRRREEFVKRGGFALLASLALHGRSHEDERFLEGIALIEQEAKDDRNFVKKGASWALRAVGGRNRALHQAALATATRLASSSDPTSKWIGKDAIRDLSRKTTQERVQRMKG